jgi:hypothetical protein
MTAKKFYEIGPGCKTPATFYLSPFWGQCHKTFLFFVTHVLVNKLGCLSLASSYSLCEILSGTNTLAYFATPSATMKKVYKV